MKTYETESVPITRVKVVALIALTMFTMSVHAQSVQTIQAALEAIVVQDKPMLTAYQNLVSMAQASPDNRQILGVTSDIVTFRLNPYDLFMSVVKKGGPTNRSDCRGTS